MAMENFDSENIHAVLKKATTIDGDNTADNPVRTPKTEERRSRSSRCCSLHKERYESCC